MSRIHDVETIYRDFHPKILRYLQRLCGEEDAADLAQTVFLNVSRSLDSFRGESSLSTWIYRIATNVARDHAGSSAARRKEWEEAFDEDTLPEEVAGALPSADRDYIRREMHECIRGVIDGLPGSYRSVVILSELDELSNAEIAEVLGISLDAVKIRLHRGRTALREALECECHFYRDERNELMCDRKD